MPYDEAFLDTIIREYNFEKDYSIKCIEANRHNYITATYHLISKRNKRALALKENNVLQTLNNKDQKSNIVSMFKENKALEQKRPIDLN